MMYNNSTAPELVEENVGGELTEDGLKGASAALPPR